MDEIIHSWQGRGEVLRITVAREAGFEEIRQAIKARMARHPAFYKGGQGVALCGAAMDEAQRESLAAWMYREFGILSLSFEDEKEAACQEEPPSQQPPPADKAEEPEPSAAQMADSPGNSGIKILPVPTDKTQFIHGLIRSGQRIRANGHVVIVGDVNPGAELIADGSIVVMGALRGKAHAGYAGDERAVIAALSLQPTLLAIAKVVNLPPEEGLEKAGYPEKARLLAGKIVIEPLTD
ncbi:Septum site-determining protein MinC [uncultured Clostridium sp.]|nr:Septum site-determining protein MinC [uncultured Clostridium sp.]